MNRCLLCVLLVMLVAYGAPQAAPAETLAFIPNGDGNVTRVNTTEGEETFNSVEFSATDALFGAAATPSGAHLLVTSGPELVDPITQADLDNSANWGVVSLMTTANILNNVSPTNRTVRVHPRGVAVDSQGRFAYVANFEDDSLSRINMSTLLVSGDPIDLGEGSGPFGVAAFFDEVDDIVKVYVTNNKENTVSLITDDGTIATIEPEIIVGSNPVGIAITPDGSFVYVANNGSDSVSIIQTSDNTVVNTIAVDSNPDTNNEPWGVAVGSDGDFVYVTNSNIGNTGTDSVMVIATSTQSVQISFSGVNQPMGVAAPKNGDFAYVVNQGDDTITRIDMSSQTETTIGLGEISNASALGAFIGGTPPNAPSGLTTTVQSFDEIELTWTDNASDELGFKIERREDSEEGFIRIAKVDADVTTFSDGSLSDETTYHYRVSAFNEAADSNFATEASATTEEGSFSWCFIQTLMR